MKFFRTTVLVWVALTVVLQVEGQSGADDPLEKLKTMWKTARNKAADSIDVRYGEELAKLSAKYEAAGDNYAIGSVEAQVEMIALLKGEKDPEEMDRTLTILEARYGSAEQFDQETTKDVTEKVRALVENDELSFTPGKELFGDPHPFKLKEFKIRYQIGEKEFEGAGKVNVPITFPTGREDFSEDPIEPPEEVTRLREIWYGARVKATGPIDQTFERELERMRSSALSKRDQDLVDRIDLEMENFAALTADPTAAPREQYQVEGEEMFLEKPNEKVISVDSENAFADEMSGGQHLLWHTPKENSEVKATFNIPVDGTYDVEGQFLVGWDFGKVTIKLNRTTLARNVDFYAEEPDIAVRELGRVDLRAGDVVIVLEHKGRNKESSGDQISLDFLRFLKVE